MTAVRGMQFSGTASNGLVSRLPRPIAVHWRQTHGGAFRAFVQPQVSTALHSDSDGDRIAFEFRDSDVGT